MQKWNASNPLSVLPDHCNPGETIADSLFSHQPGRADVMKNPAPPFLLDTDETHGVHASAMPAPSEKLGIVTSKRGSADPHPLAVGRKHVPDVCHA